MNMTTIQRAPPRSSFFQSVRIQMDVIGAILMRELHTRYGRDNIGYLWLIGEPLMLGSVISLLHVGWSVRDGMDPVTLAGEGYAIFIMFRGIVNRSEGALHSNLPLLYHRMVTAMDIVIARALLEGAGTFLSFVVLLSMLIAVGRADFPVRPLMLALGIAYVFWMSLGVSMIVVGGTFERRTMERLVHPFTYFMIPLSGAFYRVGWAPVSLRKFLLLSPMPQAFELVRYGQFQDATLEYVNFIYMTFFCLTLSIFGLVAMRSVRSRIHLS